MLSGPVTYEDMEGSPYYINEFKYGNIYYGTNQVKDIPLRLNLFDDLLEYKQKDRVMVFGNPDRIDSVVIGEEVFIHLPERRNYKVSGFVKLLNSNTPALFMKMKVAFIHNNVSNSRPDQSKVSEFKRVPDHYYIRNRFDEVKRITGVNHLIKEFGNHRTELREYSKGERISVNDPKALLGLFDYYNELESK